MARKDQVEFIVTVSQFLSILGERVKELLLKLPPGILANVTLITGVAFLSIAIFKYVTKDSPPVKIPQSAIEIPPWMIPSALVIAATMLLLL